MKAYILISCAAFGTALAQQPGPNLAVIRKTTPLSAIDRQTVCTWADAQLTQLFNAQNPQIDGPKFMAALLEHHRAADASPAFREGLARCLVDSFTRQYVLPPAGIAANPPIVLPVVYPLLVLRQFRDPVAYEAYRRALGDPSPGVRVAALDGLLLLRDQLTAQQWAQLLPDLQRVGGAENDPFALDRLFRFLSVTEPQRVQQVLPVVLNILEARLTLVEQKRQWPTLGDGLAASWLGARFPAANTPQLRSNIARQLARILADAVYSFVNQHPTELEKEQLERVIMAAEAQIKVITAGRAQPDVTAAMRGGGPNQTAKMSAELEKWIGNAGVLTQPPLSLQAGLNIKRPPPTTGTAPG